MPIPSSSSAHTVPNCEGLGEVEALFERILEQTFGAWFGGLAA
jgi:hypothetical protein